MAWTGEMNLWMFTGIVYYFAAFFGFLVYRLFFSRWRDESDPPSGPEADNLMIIFTHGVNPLFAALLFPLFLPFLLFLQYILMNLARKHLPENRTEVRPGNISSSEEERLMNEQGESINDLRPSGTVRVGDRHIEAVAESGFIPRGRTVTLVRRDGFPYVVREIAGGSAKGAGDQPHSPPEA
ncbi:MAG: NfeD family protein [Opitutales bacterium]